MDENRDIEKNQYELPRGTVIGGKYEVLRKIGHGGMSDVYLVMDTHLMVNWALKVVRRKGIKDFEVVRQGLIMETEMLKKLNHTHLPRIVDVIDKEGMFYIVMDYIQGKTLLEVLREYGPQGEERIVDWGLQLCSVLQYLHSQEPKIIYRDMKPGNVMLNPQGELILIDFGTAKEFKKAKVADTVSLGTPGYAAKEQFGGLGITDERTDIFGLGATLHQLITGKDPCLKPFDFTPIRQIEPSLSPGLEKILQKCTEDRPEDRYQKCSELIYDLQHYTEIGKEHTDRQKRKLAAFLLPLTAGLLSIGFTIYSYAGMRNTQRSNYQIMLNLANDMATKSIYRGEYDQDVIDKFTQTIDIDPSREEAYERLLDYCIGVGNTEAGLNAVCSRIDSGTGRINRNNDLLLSVAQLYFGGTARDQNFRGDYVKAAKYFSLIDEKVLPEAACYSQLAQTLGSFSSKVDWETLEKTLSDFSELNQSQTLNVEKIRNDLLAAGVYTANKRDFNAMGIDPYERAEKLLKRALDGIIELEKDTGIGVAADRSLDELPYLHIQVLEDLSVTYGTAYTVGSSVQDYDRALDCLEQLMDLVEDPDKLQSVYFREAELTVLQGDENKIQKTYKALIQKYPSVSNAYLGYAMYLYDQKRVDESAEYYLKALNCVDAGENSNLDKLGIKLRNAGALKEGD